MQTEYQFKRVNWTGLIAFSMAVLVAAELLRYFLTVRP